MRYPDFLSKVGRIGFIAPSCGCGDESHRPDFDAAVSYFEGLGYKTVKGPNCYENKGIGKSNTAKACGEEINDFFTNDRSDIIIACAGGETMCEDLSFVDFESISKTVPKWYMGYSDNTNLTFLLPTLTDTAAVYGPNAPGYGMNPLHPCLSDAFSLLKGEKLSFKNYDRWEQERVREPFVPYNLTTDYSQRIYIGNKMIYEGKGSKWDSSLNEVSFSGRLLGGCLDCLVNLCGTRFDKVKDFIEKYKNDGIIWFLESCDLNLFSMRRALWQLKEAGWFKYAKGFVIGRPLHFEDEEWDMDRYSAVMSILSELDLPVVMDVDLGHLPPRIPFISGAIAKVTARENSFMLEHTLK